MPVTIQKLKLLFPPIRHDSETHGKIYPKYFKVPGSVANMYSPGPGSPKDG